MNNKSLFEIINSVTLILVYYINKLFRLPKYINKQKIILCYHSVGEGSWRFTTPTKVFSQHLAYLSKNYKLTDINTLLTKDLSGAVAITFDDGYQDVYENAQPILQKYKLTAAMFVLGDAQKANRVELDNNLKIINLDKVKKLHNKGWEIGYHTNTHSHLGEMSERQLTAEIITTKKILEKKLGFPIKLFAYPKGVYTRRIAEIVKEEYKAAFTVDGGVYKNNNMMLLTRVPMEGVVDIKQFSALLSPLGLYINSFYMNVLKIKEKISRRLNKK